MHPKLHAFLSPAPCPPWQYRDDVRAAAGQARYSKGTSKFRGVSRSYNKWRAHKGNRSLGVRASEVEAARLYDRHAIQQHGRCAANAGQPEGGGGELCWQLVLLVAAAGGPRPH